MTEFDIVGRPLGVGLSGDVVAVVLTDAKGQSSSEKGTIWIEGRSLADGRKVYSTDPYEADFEFGSTAVQGSDGTLFVFTEKVTTALNPANGSTLWEAPIGGRVVYAGDLLVLEQFRPIMVLDPSTGALLAQFQPEDADHFSHNVCANAGRLLAFYSKGILSVFDMTAVGAVR
jgi:outer membrane protein assembly factor BamB